MTSLFKLVYLENANKDPLVRKLQEPAIKFVETLEKIQGVNKVLYGGLTAVNTLISTLPKSDFEINKIQRMHNENWKITDEVFRNYYLICVDLVNILSNELDTMTEVGRMRNVLERKYGLSVKNSLLLKQAIYEDKDYKNLVRKLLGSQHKFKSINMKRIRTSEQLKTQLYSLLQLQTAISRIDNHDAFREYDLTQNYMHFERVVRNIKDYIALFTKALSEFESNNNYLEKLRLQIYDIESAYRKANGSDPNFYISYSGIHNNEDLYHTANKVSRALNLEMQNLKSQLDMVEKQEQFMNKRKRSILVQPARYNPRVLGLAAEKSAVGKLIKEQMNDAGLLVTEIGECMEKDHNDLEFCVSHLRAVKGNDLKKIQSHISYIKAQQAITKEFGRYSKLLMLLYNAMSKAIKSEQVNELDRQSLLKRHEMADAIARQVAATKDLSKHSDELNSIMALYKKSIESGSKSDNKALQEAIGKLAATQQDQMEIANTMRKMSEDHVKRATQTNVHFVSGVDNDDVKEEIRKSLGSPKNMRMEMDADFDRKHNPKAVDRWGPAGSSWKPQLDDPKPFGLGTNADLQKYFTTEQQSGGARDNNGIRGDNYSVQNLSKLMRKELNISGGAKEIEAHLQVLLNSMKQDIHNGGRKGLKRKSKQSGGAGILTLISDNYTLTQYLKILEDELMELKAKMLRNVNAGPNAVVDQVKIELLINSKREELIQNKLNSMGTANSANFDKILGHINKQYLLNALYANIGAYKKVHNKMDNIVEGFKLQNSVVRMIFAKVIRKIDGNGPEATKIRDLNTKFGDAITLLHQQVMKINNLCRNDKINLSNVISYIDKYEVPSATATAPTTTIDDVLKEANLCTKSIGFMKGLVLNLVDRTNDLLTEMDLVQERAIVIETRKKLENVNIVSPQSQRLLANKIFELANEINQELKIFINQFMNSAYAIHSNIIGDKITNIDGNHFIDIQRTLDDIAKNVPAQSATPSTDVKGRLIDLLNDLDTINKEIAAINTDIASELNAAQTSGNRVDSSSLLKVNILIQKRVKNLQRIGYVVETIEKQLVNQRFALEDLASSDFKHTMMVVHSINRMIILLYATSYGIKEKIIKLNTLAAIISENQQGRNAPTNYSEFSTWALKVADATTKVWGQLKEQLDILVLAPTDNRLKSAYSTPGLSFQSGGASQHQGGAIGADKFALIIKTNNLIAAHIKEQKAQITQDYGNLSRLLDISLDKILSTRLIEEVIRNPNLHGREITNVDQLLLVADMIWRSLHTGNLNNKGQPIDLLELIQLIENGSPLLIKMAGGAGSTDPLWTSGADHTTMTSGFANPVIGNTKVPGLTLEPYAEKALQLLTRSIATTVGTLMAETVRIYAMNLKVVVARLQANAMIDTDNAKRQVLCNETCDLFKKEANDLLLAINNTYVKDARRGVNWIYSLTSKKPNEVMEKLSEIIENLINASLGESGDKVDKLKTAITSEPNLNTVIDIKHYSDSLDMYVKLAFIDGNDIEELNKLIKLDEIVAKAREIVLSILDIIDKNTELIKHNAIQLVKIYNEVSTHDGCTNDKYIHKYSKKPLDDSLTRVVRHITREIANITDNTSEINNIEVEPNTNNKLRENIDNLLNALIRLTGASQVYGATSSGSVFNLYQLTEKIMGVCRIGINQKIKDNVKATTATPPGPTPPPPPPPPGGSGTGTGPTGSGVI